MRRFSMFCFAVSTLVPSLGSAADAIVPASDEERRELIARARVWVPTEVGRMDILAGPQGGRSWRMGDTIRCTFIEPDRNDPPGGMTPKFNCTDETGDDLKIKYGTENGEVPAEIAASRLLWALGFAADRNFPVRVECRNCPRDPWRYITDKLSGRYDWEMSRHDNPFAMQAYERGDFLFIPALVEKKFKGKTIERKDDQGWSFPELRDFGGVPHEEQIRREALILLLSMIQHADNKTHQQRLQCPEPEVVKRGDGSVTCRSARLVVHDLGWTFGFGYLPRESFGASKMELEHWRMVRVWKDRATCRTGVNGLPGPRGLEDLVVREEARAFLAGLLAQLTRKQIEDIFHVARVELRHPVVRGYEEGRSRVKDWADVFEAKRREIAEVRCPN